MSLIQDIQKIKSDRKDLRSFALTVGGVLAALGAWLLWRGKPYAAPLLCGGAILIAAGLFSPPVLKAVHKIWMTLALCLGWGMTRILLSVLFYGILTPLGLIARIFGKEFLDLSFRTDAASYWIKRPPQGRDKKRYELQY